VKAIVKFIECLLDLVDSLNEKILVDVPCSEFYLSSLPDKVIMAFSGFYRFFSIF